MRLFFALDGTKKFQELDSKKVSMAAGDIVVVHDEDSEAYFYGSFVIANQTGIQVILPKNKTFEIKKQPESIVFFTKIPQDISIVDIRKNDVPMLIKITI